jgi:hypothetical protein
MEAGPWHEPCFELRVFSLYDRDELHPKNSASHRGLFLAGERDIVLLPARNNACLTGSAFVEVYYHTPAGHYILLT